MIPEAARNLREPLSPAERHGICKVAELLEPDERALLLAVYRDGQRISEYADRCGENRATVTHRRQRIIDRLLRPEAELAVRHARYLPGQLRQFAMLLWVRGLGATEAGRRLGWSPGRSAHARDKLLVIAQFWANVREDVSA